MGNSQYFPVVVRIAHDGLQSGGRTIETTVLPEVNQIMADVTTAINAAAEARNCSTVMNSAGMGWTVANKPIHSLAPLSAGPKQ